MPSGQPETPAAPSSSGGLQLPKQISLEQVAFAVCAAAVVFFLFYKLGEVPAGLYHDETITGYDARSINRTLHDHYGVPLPLFFESFPGDYKSPIYIYVASINELILGVRPFSLRLTSVEFALAIAFGLFLLLRALTGNQRFARWMALFSLLIPSLFFYARVSSAENICFTGMLSLAMYPLLRFERDPTRRNAIVAGGLLALSAYTYHTAHLLVPLMVLIAAASYYFDPGTKKQLPAFLGAAAAVGAPMALFAILRPDTLTHRFMHDVGVWHDHPSTGVVISRFVGSYLQHLGSLDFLFRTGQHQLTINMGVGLLPIWMWIPVLLGLGSLWERRQSPFARFALAMIFVSPLAVALTWENLPHTGRIFHILLFAYIAASLAVFDWISRAHPARWVLALLIGGVLLEGAQDLTLYFGDYASTVRRQRSFEDDNAGEALTIAFAARKGEEPLYVPHMFFQTYGTYLEFYGDLDPVRRRAVGLEGMGILEAERPINPDQGGIIVTRLGRPPPVAADLIGTTQTPELGGPSWQVWRIRPPSASSN